MKKTGKTISFGLLLFVVWQLLSYFSALVTGTQGKDAADVDFNSMPLVISGIIIALLMAGATYWFGRKLRLDTKRDALTAGAWWVVILVALQIFTTMPYQTTKALFGAWVMYLPYLAILAGTARSVRPQPKPAPAGPPAQPAVN